MSDHRTRVREYTATFELLDEWTTPVVAESVIGAYIGNGWALTCTTRTTASLTFPVSAQTQHLFIERI